MLKNGTGKTKQTAAQSLAAIHDERSLRPLIDALADEAVTFFGP